MPLTSTQQRAVAATGNVLVVAGAGTGKTRTLVERCLAQVLDEQPPVTMDRVLMVTFTEAAAVEMRRRIREALEERAASQPPESSATRSADGHVRPGEARLQEQLALLDLAPIGTLHGFCRQLVRLHSYALDLDPEVAVLDPPAAARLADSTLDALLERHYTGKTALDQAVQDLILLYGRGRDRAIRDLVLKLHDYTETLPDPVGWLATARQVYDQPAPTRWETWLRDGLEQWAADWMFFLEAQPPENETAARCAALLASVMHDATNQPARRAPAPVHFPRESVAAVLAGIEQADQAWPKGKKTRWRKPLAPFFEDAAFLAALFAVTPGRDPLTEDWTWLRPHLIALLDLAREFGEAYAANKRNQGVVDFHDLEQFALRLLWDEAARQPTPLARQWRQRLERVFVDEYQDINAAQDRILQALSREGADANRFLVGDIKQSIYRFRLADPRIFQGYVAAWKRPANRHHVIPLVENFRSHPTILRWVNHCFARLMRAEVGGVDFDRDAELVFGDPTGRLRGAADDDAAEPATPPAARVELHLYLRDAPENGDGDEPSPAGPEPVDRAALSDTEREARLVAGRLTQMRARGLLLWDESQAAMRPVDWSDMVILLRAPRHKVESYAKEFSRCGVPLIAARGDFSQGTEITDWLSLLQLLDNPLQDVPLLAVLRSPLVGLRANDLAAIRLAAPRRPLWTALRRFHDAAHGAPAWPAVHRFLERFARWRPLTRRTPLSRCLETVLDETHYLDWLLNQPRGQIRRANLQRFLSATRQFDRHQRQGLFHFLRFIEAEQATEAEGEPVAFGDENAVRLMSIHQAKGLEFPLVVVADLGRAFHFDELKHDIILDDEYGLAAQIKPPGIAQPYPSLPYWLARRRQRREALGEEMRLLYVAMTRARDWLILAGNDSRKHAEVRWGDVAGNQSGPLPTPQLVAARSYLDWLGPVVTAWTGRPDWATQPNGQARQVAWNTYRGDAQLSETASAEAGLPTAEPPDPDTLANLQARLGWQYPQAAATSEPAKTSVSALRRRLAEESDDESQPAFRFDVPAAGRVSGSSAVASTGNLSAVQSGIAHHVFQQQVDLRRVEGRRALEQEADWLERQGMLSADERRSLDLAALDAFWQAEPGRQFLSQVNALHRELPFTARFAPAELAQLGLTAGTARLEGEFVVVQGVVDLAAILPSEIWLLDLKTDALEPAELPARTNVYAPQLKLYAAALSRIYRRPVTAVWLHFLGLRRSVRVNGQDDTASASVA